MTFGLFMEDGYLFLSFDQDELSVCIKSIFLKCKYDFVTPLLKFSWPYPFLDLNPSGISSDARAFLALKSFII